MEMTSAEIERGSWEISCVKSDARRYCDQHEITDIDTYYTVVRSMAHRRYMEAIEPFLKMRSRILYMHCMVYPKRYVMQKNGQMEQTPEILPATQTESIRRLDEAIAEEAKKWGFETEEIKSDSKV